MEEERSRLIERYKTYHSEGSKDTAELQSLEKEGRELLSFVKPESRYVCLGMQNFYESILGKIAQKFERNEDSIQKMKFGFHCLEKYAINLWKFPWRKEYHSIKVC